MYICVFTHLWAGVCIRLTYQCALLLNLNLTSTAYRPTVDTKTSQLNGQKSDKMQNVMCEVQLMDGTKILTDNHGNERKESWLLTKNGRRWHAEGNTKGEKMGVVQFIGNASLFAAQCCFPCKNRNLA